MYRFAEVGQVFDLVPPHTGDALEVRVEDQQLGHEISVDNLLEILWEDIGQQLGGGLSFLFF